MMKIFDNVLDGVVLIVAVFFFLAGVASALIGAANNVSASGLPLSSLFGSTGVTLTLFMIAVFIAIVYAVMHMYKTGRHGGY